MHFYRHGDLGQVYTPALIHSFTQFHTSCCVKSFWSECADWSSQSFHLLDRLAVIYLGRPFSQNVVATGLRLQCVLSWYGICRCLCLWLWLLIVYIHGRFLHLQLVGKGDPRRLRLLLRYVSHIDWIDHDLWHLLRGLEEVISRWGARSEVDAIENVASSSRCTVAYAGATTIIRRRNRHLAEESVGWIPGCLYIHILFGAKRAKVLLPASLIAKLLRLLPMCSLFQITGEVLIGALRDGALRWRVEVRKAVRLGWHIMRLLVYQGDMVATVGNFIHTFPSSLIHRMLYLGPHLSWLNISLFIFPFRRYAVTARILGINLLQHTVLTRVVILEHHVEVLAVHAVDAEVTWAFWYFKTGVHIAASLAPPRGSSVISVLIARLSHDVLCEGGSRTFPKQEAR